MRSLVFLGAICSLSACSNAADERADQCRESVKMQLKSPASYSQIQQMTFFSNGRKAKSPDGTSLIQEPDVPNQMVWLKFDAVNSFNAPIRMDATCYFILSTGQMTPESPQIIGPDGATNMSSLP